MGLHVLGVEQSAPYTAPVGHTDDHGDWQCPVGAVTGPGRLADQLVYGWPDEIGELDLGDGTHSPEGGAQGDTHDGRFGQGRVDDAVIPELLSQTLGGQEHAAPDANVFSQDEDLGVAGHLFPDGLPDCFDNAFNGQDNSI